MSFKDRWTKEAKATFDDLQAKATAAKENRSGKAKKKSTQAEGLFNQVEKCVRLLLANPKHPGLHTHEFTSLEHPYDPKQ